MKPTGAKRSGGLSFCVSAVNPPERKETVNLTTTVNQKQLLDILLNVGLVRPIFIWGAPGIGKSAIVEQIAEQVGLPCVSLLGSQLAPAFQAALDGLNESYEDIRDIYIYTREDDTLMPLDRWLRCTDLSRPFYIGGIIDYYSSAILGNGSF